MLVDATFGAAGLTVLTTAPTDSCPSRRDGAAAVEAGGPAHALLAALDRAGWSVGVPLRAGRCRRTTAASPPPAWPRSASVWACGCGLAAGVAVAPAAGAMQRHLPWFTVVFGAALVGLGGWLLAGRDLPGFTRWAGRGPAVRCSA